MRSMSVVALFAVAALAHAGEPGHYGQPLPAGEAVSIAAAVDAHESYAGKPGRYRGRIAEVCQMEGCWMVLEDNGRSARVMMRDHKFAVPKDAAGMAEVHGVLSRKQLSPEAVKHMQEDAGNGLPVADVEYRIDADGVEISG